MNFYWVLKIKIITFKIHFHYNVNEYKGFYHWYSVYRVLNKQSKSIHPKSGYFCTSKSISNMQKNVISQAYAELEIFQVLLWMLATRGSRVITDIYYRLSLR